MGIFGKQICDCVSFHSAIKRVQQRGKVKAIKVEEKEFMVDQISLGDVERSIRRLKKEKDTRVNTVQNEAWIFETVKDWEK